MNRDTADRLERELESAKAEAWDEGFLAADITSTGYPDNPYRSQS